jgi:hypothetical protein
MKNKTWIYVNEEEAKGKEILTSRWVFKKKDDGKFKARLVARGCTQDKEKMDYENIYSPVVDTTSLRLLLAIAARKDWKIQTLDVKTAFLYGDLEENIYMRVPEGYNQPGKICMLQKSLYGLRQAPCQWNRKFTSFLKDQKLIQLQVDQCIFKSENRDMYLAIHVDDGILIGQNLEKMKKLQSKLKEEFQMTFNEEPKCYLGIQLEKTEGGIILSQENYASKVLEKFSMENARPQETPITQDIKMEEKDEDSKEDCDYNYREMVGSLLYLSCKTRPDLSFAVNYESRFMESPKRQDFLNVNRTLRYLRGTTNASIFYSKENEPKEDLKLVAFCDSDYAGDTRKTGDEAKNIRRKSTSGYVIMLSNGPIAWSSRRQSVVAQSTMEAELIAACECAKELKFIKMLLKELTDLEVKATLFIDNQSTLKMIKAGRIKAGRHIEVKYFFVKDEYQKGLFDIQYVPTDHNISDIFTKPLSPVIYQKFMNKLLQFAKNS